MDYSWCIIVYMKTIYTLSDPRTGQVRYVGKTGQELQRRLRGHIEKSRNLKNKWHVACWIRNLTSEGLSPIIETIRVVEDQYIDETEVFCIAEYLRLGCDLTNGTKGGDGGVTSMGRPHTAEAIRKREITRRARKSAGSAWRGKKQPQHVIDARMAGYTPEKRAAAIQKMKETRARRKAIAEAFGVRLYAHPNPHRPEHTDETKALLSEKAKEQWANYTEEQREFHKNRAKGNLEEFLRKVREGEIEDPRLGKTPWNKGIDQGPEVGYKSWETKRANGFVSQKEMLQDIASKTGHSWSKVQRALKGESHKVAPEALLDIWSYYEEHSDEYPKLTIVKIDTKVDVSS